MTDRVIILGAGGHARVLAEILWLQSYDILGYTDRVSSRLLKLPTGEPINYLGADDVLLQYETCCVCLVNGLGGTGSPTRRKELFERMKGSGHQFSSVIHTAAVISPSAALAEGVQVMAGAVIQTGSRLGCNTIVNTKASVDHDCEIGRHVHIAPGATLSGAVVVEDGVHIGVGATVIQGIRIGANSLVGAGAVVVRDVPPGVKVVGVPAREVPW